jgi:hypothetical protein
VKHCEIGDIRHHNADIRKIGLSTPIEGTVRATSCEPIRLRPASPNCVGDIGIHTENLEVKSPVENQKPGRPLRYFCQRSRIRHNCDLKVEYDSGAKGV